MEPALATIERFAALGRSVHPYQFTRVSPAARACGDLAKHTCEIRYIFGTREPESHDDATDRAVAETMQQAWTSFAATGTPVVDSQPWSRYRHDSPLQRRRCSFYR